MKIILFFHVEKNGGSSVISTLNHNGFGTFFYGTHHCFRGLPWHGSVFGNESWPSGSRACKRVSQLRNVEAHARVVVEFHSWSKAVFWHDFAPRRAALDAHHRQKYGGYVRTLVVLRDPIAHQRSTYMMWPPLRGEKRHQEPVPYESWLQVVESGGLQTRLITGSRNCNVTLAASRLNAFTDVQRLETLNLNSFCETPCPLRHVKPTYSASAELVRRLKRDVATADPQVVARAAACDQRLLDKMSGRLAST